MGITTFQAIIYALVHGLSEFQPVGVVAHRALLTYFLGWPEPSSALLGALSLGSFLALLVYFIHDWISMSSSLLQVLIYRRKPMTMDERMPLFVLLAVLPMGAAWYWLNEEWTRALDSIPWVAASVAGFGILLWVVDSMSRRNKKMYDWNIIDSLLIGVLGIASLVPGCDRRTATLAAGLFRGYSREAAAKFGFFVAAPLVLVSVILHLRDLNFMAPMPADDLSWLSFGTALVVAFFASLLGIVAMMKNAVRTGVGQYVIWRLGLATAAGVVYWMRSQG